MFCRIKIHKNGWNFNIMLCERKRENGKVKAKDTKIGSYNMIAIYEHDEEYNGLILDLPKIGKKVIKQDVEFAGMSQYFNIVVEKLIEFKKEYYTTYKELSIELDKKEELKAHKKQKQLEKEYQEFKKKYYSLYSKEIEEVRRNAYMSRLNENINKYINNGSNKPLNARELEILKKVFKAAALKYHPDKQGGNNEVMIEINNLKEKMLK